MEHERDVSGSESGSDSDVDSVDDERLQRILDQVAGLQLTDEQRGQALFISLANAEMQEAVRQREDEERRAATMAREDITEKQKLFLITLQDDMLKFHRQGGHNTYDYTSLDPQKTEIRLVTVLPGQWEDRIRCEITVVSLKENPEYEALSYSWGNPEIKDPIWVGDKQIGVTSNCLKALRRFRSRAQPVTLWIDAICINQSDNEEKSWQVGLMGEIYKSTQRVLIWLGENDPLGDVEEPLDRSGGPSMALGSTMDPFVFLRDMASDKHFDDCAFFFRGHNTEVSWEMQFDAVVQSTWWTRIWVVQETLLPPKALVAFSAASIEWKDVVTAVKNIHKHAHSCCAQPWGANAWTIDISTLTRAVGEIESSRNELQEKKHVAMQHLLGDFRARDATNDRDKLYGILGMASPWKSHPPLIPDYSPSSSTSALFEEVTWRIIQETGNLDVLIALGHSVWDEAPAVTGRTAHAFLRPQRMVKLADLPSWVPDLSICEKRSEHESTRFHCSTTSYGACGQSATTQASVLQHKLKLSGIHVDVVDEVSRIPFPVEDARTAPSDSAVKAYRALEMWWEIATRKCLDRFGKEQTFLTVFWRTVLGGSIFKGPLSHLERSQPIRSATSQDALQCAAWFYGELEELFQKAMVLKRAQYQRRARGEDAGIDETMEEKSFAFTNSELIKRVWDSDLGVSVKVAAARRTCFTTLDGRVAIGPSNVRPWDLVIILDGGKVPFIVRLPREKLQEIAIEARERTGQLPTTVEPFTPEVCSFVGDCYVDDLMDGKYADNHQEDKRAIEIL